MRKLTRGEKTLFVAPFCVLALSLGVGQWRLASEEARRDPLEREARALAGYDAVDCGRTRINEFSGDYDAMIERGESDAQAFSTYKKALPSFVIHDQGTFGGPITHQSAIVRTPQGQLCSLTSGSQGGTKVIGKKLFFKLFYKPIAGGSLSQLHCQ